MSYHYHIQTDLTSTSIIYFSSKCTLKLSCELSYVTGKINKGTVTQNESMNLQLFTIIV